MSKTNKDFSSLLNQSDKNVLGELRNPTKKKKTAADKQRYVEILKRKKQREKYVPEEKEEPYGGTQWRDRATERRNAAGDYSKIAQEYQLLKGRTEEESKFLGGDEEHTHLVKGLDYRLLEKVRAEIEKKEETRKKLMEERAAQHGIAIPLQQAERPTTTSPLVKRICNELIEQVHPHHSSFQKKLQRIESVVLRGAQFRGNTKNFKPGKMIYQFDVRWERNGRPDGEGVPVILYESESRSGSSAIHSVVAPVHEKILSDISDALEWAVQNKKGARRIGRKDAPLTEDEPKEADTEKAKDDDDDIFGGIGGYNPSEMISKVESEQGEANVSELRRGGNYFGEEDDDESDKDVDPLLPDGLAGKIESVRKRGGEEVVEAKRKAMIDDYNECYPEMGMEISWSCRAGSDDDDEEEGKKRKRKGVSGLKRFLWLICVSQKDNDAGGEKKKPKLTARAMKRQTEREWKKIEHMMETKKGKKGLDSFEKEMPRPSSSSSAMNVL
ncbi:protein Red-like [Condylostylus longicornis]|uniref:protein Red-like n=1 Tax=Condylostylus longicornis TaxID=2530218 RepID=UPI00244DAF23|nr:protein Red-like [Condylostylus longicornis]